MIEEEIMRKQTLEKFDDLTKTYYNKIDVPIKMNLNEDPLLSKKIIHNLIEKKVLKIGRDFENVKNDIIINGIGI